MILSSQAGPVPGSTVPMGTGEAKDSLASARQTVSGKSAGAGFLSHLQTLGEGLDGLQADQPGELGANGFMVGVPVQPELLEQEPEQHGSAIATPELAPNSHHLVPDPFVPASPVQSAAATPQLEREESRPVPELRSPRFEPGMEPESAAVSLEESGQLFTDRDGAPSETEPRPISDSNTQPASAVGETPVPNPNTPVAAGNGEASIEPSPNAVPRPQDGEHTETIRAQPRTTTPDLRLAGHQHLEQTASDFTSRIRVDSQSKDAETPRAGRVDAGVIGMGVAETVSVNTSAVETRADEGAAEVVSPTAIDETNGNLAAPPEASWSESLVEPENGRRETIVTPRHAAARQQPTEERGKAQSDELTRERPAAEAGLLPSTRGRDPEPVSKEAEWDEAPSDPLPDGEPQARQADGRMSAAVWDTESRMLQQAPPARTPTPQSPAARGATLPAGTQTSHGETNAASTSARIPITTNHAAADGEVAFYTRIRAVSSPPTAEIRPEGHPQPIARTTDGGRDSAQLRSPSSSPEIVSPVAGTEAEAAVGAGPETGSRKSLAGALKTVLPPKSDRPLPEALGGAIATSRRTFTEAAPEFRTAAQSQSAQRAQLAAAADLLPPSPVVRNVSIQVPTGRDSVANVFLSDRGGDLHVTVRTPDAGVATALRGDLGTLESRLQAAGLNAEVGSPAASTSHNDSREGSSQQSKTGSRFDDHQDQQRSSHQDSGRQRRTPWSEDVESSREESLWM